jgi:thioredoxin 1
MSTQTHGTIELTSDNFDREVLQSDVPVLVDFWATWCPPCRAIAPTIDELAGEFEGRAKVGKVDVDKANEIGARYGISSIPTILIFKSGEVVAKHVGLSGKDTLADSLQSALS